MRAFRLSAGCVAGLLALTQLGCTAGSPVAAPNLTGDGRDVLVAKGGTAGATGAAAAAAAEAAAAEEDEPDSAGAPAGAKAEAEEGAGAAEEAGGAGQAPQAGPAAPPVVPVTVPAASIACGRLQIALARAALPQIRLPIIEAMTAIGCPAILRRGVPILARGGIPWIGRRLRRGGVVPGLQHQPGRGGAKGGLRVRDVD